MAEFTMRWQRWRCAGGSGGSGVGGVDGTVVLASPASTWYSSGVWPGREWLRVAKVLVTRCPVERGRLLPAA